MFIFIAIIVSIVLCVNHPSNFIISPQYDYKESLSHSKKEVDDCNDFKETESIGLRICNEIDRFE